MSTTPPVLPVTTPVSKVQSILNIINFALGGLAMIPALAVPIAIEQGFQKILTNALAVYQAETGKPFDLTQIPLEKPID